MDANPDSAPRYIRGPQLRKRWANMPASTFYRRLKAGQIPAARYPFGQDIPYWRLDEIEEFERRAETREAA